MNGTTVQAISAALANPFDAIEALLAAGGSLASAYAFAADAAVSLPVADDTAPESARTVLANTATIRA